MSKYQWEVGGQPPQKRAWQQWSIIQPPVTGTLQVWPMRPIYFSLITHFDKATRICTGDHCSMCSRGLGKRWAGYIPVRLANPVQGRGVLAITRDVAKRITQMKPYGISLDECHVRVGRNGISKYSPIKVHEVAKSSDSQRGTDISGSVESTLHLVGVPDEDVAELAKTIYEHLALGTAAAQAQEPPAASRSAKNSSTERKHGPAADVP